MTKIGVRHRIKRTFDAAEGVCEKMTNGKDGSKALHAACGWRGRGTGGGIGIGRDVYRRAGECGRRKGGRLGTDADACLRSRGKTRAKQ